MPTPPQRSKVFGGVIMALLLLGAVLLASVPVLAGVVAGAFLPGPGGLREGTGLGALAHLLWIYPVLYVVATVVDGVGTYLRGGGARSKASVVVEFVVLWVALTLMLTVFLERIEAAAVGAAVAVVLYWPFVRYLERNSGDDAEPETAG